jgi:hypothetical protein
LFVTAAKVALFHEFGNKLVKFSVLFIKYTGKIWLLRSFFVPLHIKYLN